MRYTEFSQKEPVDVLFGVILLRKIRSITRN